MVQFFRNSIRRTLSRQIRIVRSKNRRSSPKPSSPSTLGLGRIETTEPSLQRDETELSSRRGIFLTSRK